MTEMMIAYSRLPVRDDPRTFTVRESGWGAFVLANLPAIEDEYGTVEAARRLALLGELRMGGGAAPATLVQLLSDNESTRQAMWCLYDLTVNRHDRRDVFRRIVALGFDRREAAEMIQSCEREG